ncbi:Na(+)-translocating NADH-quinone reductase subunit A [termite gut metagenome]|uniref:Na(+)-translocating NADH-quinone reductase subunit A n=1 Tax=termite gut metagenome TaxID=433724 RepID=A0A5J4PBJ9_9ZZZZ
MNIPKSTAGTNAMTTIDMIRLLSMDILPEYLLKAIITNDIDRMEQLGIYEIAPEDFALCEFACSSKQELQRMVREGLDALRAEMS